MLGMFLFRTLRSGLAQPLSPELVELGFVLRWEVQLDFTLQTSAL